MGVCQILHNTILTFCLPNSQFNSLVISPAVNIQAAEICLLYIGVSVVVSIRSQRKLSNKLKASSD